MPETIPVHCASCSKSSWHIAHVPGKNELKCSQCNSRTVVRIAKDGSVNTEKVGCYLANEVNLALRNGGVSPIALISLIRLKRNISRSKDSELEFDYYRLSQEYVSKLRRMTDEDRRSSLEELEAKHLQPILHDIEVRDFVSARRKGEELVALLRL